MDSFVKADVFFFITSISVLALTLGLFIIIFYLIRILSDVKHISKSVREKSDTILDDIEKLRETIKSGAWIQAILGLFNLGRNEKVAKTRKRKSKTNAS